MAVMASLCISQGIEKKVVPRCANMLAHIILPFVSRCRWQCV